MLECFVLLGPQNVIFILRYSDAIVVLFFVIFWVM